MERVVLAMSGGVDSSVAAHLLRGAGYDIVGVFMRHGAEVSHPKCDTEAHGSQPSLLPVLAHKQGCCTASDAADARRVAERLEIPFYALDLQSEFTRITEYFVEEYLGGRTPNPCVVCNHWLKFGRLFDFADSIDARYVATGHYGRMEPGSPPRLRRGLDGTKDQSYVLFGIGKSRLARMLLPIGEFHKWQIRERARAWGLGVAHKRDSQEICFVSSGQHADFVADRKGERQTGGELVTIDGRVVGRHAGIERFTIGQRKGLGVALGEPYFVVHIDPHTCRVTLGKKGDLAQRELVAQRVNWLVDDWPQTWRAEVQIRYNSAPQAAHCRTLANGDVHIEFADPCYGVAPGQAAVWYDGDRVIGGGWIASLAGPNADLADQVGLN